MNQLNKDTARGSRYVPSPMVNVVPFYCSVSIMTTKILPFFVQVLSFTDGDGPMGYTQLSETRYATSLAFARAVDVLPHLAGSGLSVARRYSDKIVADVSLANTPLGLIIAAVLFMGIISGIFVPRLPFEIPRRGFDMFSWMSAFYAGEVMAEEQPSNLNTKDLELSDIIELAGDLKFFYLV